MILPVDSFACKWWRELRLFAFEGVGVVGGVGRVVAG